MPHYHLFATNISILKTKIKGLKDRRALILNKFIASKVIDIACTHTVQREFRPLSNSQIDMHMHINLIYRKDIP